MQYDDGYTLTWDSTLAGNDISRQLRSGPFMSNGKIALTLMPDGRGAREIFITGDMLPRLGVYENFTIPGIDWFSVRLFASPSSSMPHAVRNFTLSLALDTGISTARYTVQDERDGTLWATVEQDVYIHRTLPYMAVQTVRVTFSQEYLDCLASGGAPPPQLFHEFTASKDFVNVTFTPSIVALPAVLDPVNMLCCSATVAADSGSSSNPTLSMCAVSYLFNTDIARNGGYNILRSSRNQAFNRIDFLADKLRAGTTYRVHLVAGMASSHDLDPRSSSSTSTSTPTGAATISETLQRLVFNVLASSSSAGPATYDDLALMLRSRHVTDWMTLWQGKLEIEPRESASAKEVQDIKRLQRAIRVSLYHVYSCTRPGGSVNVNPTNTTVVDRDGSIMYDGDLFFVPLLILINPHLARPLLQSRYASLTNAQQVAAGFGNRGAKYPYINDTSAYAQALYWDTVSPANIFNTPLVSISVWNYYRASHDLDWLANKGYTMMREVADYIVSIAKLVDSSTSTAWTSTLSSQLMLTSSSVLSNLVTSSLQMSPTSMYYTIPNVNGPAGRRGNSNAFTNYLCALALRFTIEASYELQLSIKPAWTTVLSGMVIPQTSSGIPKVDDVDAITSTTPTNTTTTTAAAVPIAEPLIILLPYFDSYYFLLNREFHANDGANLIHAALEYYSTGDRITDPDHPYNLLTRAILLARVAQSLPQDTSSSSLAEYETLLYRFLDLYSCELAFGSLNRQPASGTTANDVTMSAMLLLMLLMGPVGYRIRGGVSDTRWYYEDIQVTRNSVARMPMSWKQISVYGFGSAAYANNTLSNNTSGFSGGAGFMGTLPSSVMGTILNSNSVVL
jgi:hypothetical protein